MVRKLNTPKSWERINLGSDQLKRFFITHLDRIYAAKMHLISKLPVLATEAKFSDLKNAIEETMGGVQNQLARMQMIYTFLDAEVSSGSIHGLIGLVDDAFESIKQQDGEAELQDLSIIFYLQNIESVEMASFQILRMAAVKLDKRISALLKENYEEAKSDRALLLLISSKYIVN